jgi:RecJ-like exonuclease
MTNVSDLPDPPDGGAWIFLPEEVEFDDEPDACPQCDGHGYDAADNTCEECGGSGAADDPFTRELIDELTKPIQWLSADSTCKCPCHSWHLVTVVHSYDCCAEMFRKPHG